MKQQTFLVSLTDSNNIQRDFYRFNCKRAKTALNAIINAAQGINTIFIDSWKRDNIKNVICYATPDGYNKENITWQYTLDEILAM